MAKVVRVKSITVNGGNPFHRAASVYIKDEETLEDIQKLFSQKIREAQMTKVPFSIYCDEAKVCLLYPFDLLSSTIFELLVEEIEIASSASFGSFGSKT